MTGEIDEATKAALARRDEWERQVKRVYAAPPEGPVGPSVTYKPAVPETGPAAAGDEHPAYDELVHEAPNEVPQMLIGGFGWAHSMIMAGRAVRRSGWNGKAMFLFHGLVRCCGPDLDHQQNLICMKTAQNTVVPWLASVTDLVATDWEVV